MSVELVRRLRLGFFSDVATEIASKAADEIERLTAERDALSAQLRAAGEPVAWLYTFTLPGEYEDTVNEIYRKYQQVSADAPFGMRGHDFDGNAVTTESPLYAAPVPQPQEARDAERYRWLRDNSQTGAVKTLLPLVRSHYVVVNESAYDYPTFDEAIDAAILAAKEKK